MKRLAIFALLAAFVLGSVSMASAEVEVKASGYFKANATWTDNFNFQDAEQDEKSEDDFFIQQRARLNFSFAANEYITGFVRAQATWQWGVPGVGSSVGNNYNADGTVDNDGFDVVRAYMQFKYPNSDVIVTAGRQGLAFADAGLGNPVLDDDVDALVIAAPINDMFSLALAYARTADSVLTNSGKAHDEWDAVYVAAPITLEGFGITPYFAYSWYGKDVATLRTYSDDVNPWWLGAAFTVNALDPFSFGANLLYGAIDGDTDAEDQSGWWFDAYVAYTGLDFMTPKVFGVYSTGDDDDLASDGSGKLPTISEGFVGPGMDTMAFDDGTFLGGDNQVSAPGFWAIGFALTDITFLDKLSHDFMLAYIQGTNDDELIGSAGYTAPGNGALTDGDYVIEVDFNTQYQIYEELAAIVNLGYQFIDEDDDWNADTSDAWRVGFGLKYDF